MLMFLYDLRTGAYKVCENKLIELNFTKRLGLVDALCLRNNNTALMDSE